MSDNIIEIQHLKNHLGREWVHKDVSFSVKKGEILALIGGSGSGKTTVLRCLLMLLKPTAGNIFILGKNIKQITEDEAQRIRRRWSVVFQQSALFSALTVLENVMFPMQELTHLDRSLMRELALLKIDMVGLPLDAAYKLPSELSGGMQRRAAAARAIAMDPELLFLDEPTSGLDPLSARQFEELIVFLRDTLNLTVIVVTHDIELLRNAADRVAFIGDGQILDIAPIDQLMKNSHPMIADYFSKI